MGGKGGVLQPIISDIKSGLLLYFLTMRRRNVQNPLTGILNRTDITVHPLASS